jgi:hypothetical protein
MRKIGCSGALCLPVSDSIFVYNTKGQGILITEDNLPPPDWFTQLVMGIPDKKRISGDLGKQLTGQELLLCAALLGQDWHAVHLLTESWYVMEKSGQDSSKNVSQDVGRGWIKMVASNASRAERDRLYSSAFESVQLRVIELYRAGRFEYAMNLIMDEYDGLLRAHGYVTSLKYELTTWRISRMCDWIDSIGNGYELRTTSSGTDPPGG